MESLRRGDLEGAAVSAAERALLQFVEQLTLRSHSCQSADIQRLRDAGWTEPQIAEAVYVAAMFAFFNRVADAFGLDEPDYKEMSPSSEE